MLVSLLHILKPPTEKLVRAFLVCSLQVIRNKGVSKTEDKMQKKSLETTYLNKNSLNFLSSRTKYYWFPWGQSKYMSPKETFVQYQTCIRTATGSMKLLSDLFNHQSLSPVKQWPQRYCPGIPIHPSTIDCSDTQIHKQLCSKEPGRFTKSLNYHLIKLILQSICNFRISVAELIEARASTVLVQEVLLLAPRRLP